MTAFRLASQTKPVYNPVMIRDLAVGVFASAIWYYGHKYRHSMALLVACGFSMLGMYCFFAADLAAKIGGA